MALVSPVRASDYVVRDRLHIIITTPETFDVDPGDYHEQLIAYLIHTRPDAKSDVERLNSTVNLRRKLSQVHPPEPVSVGYRLHDCCCEAHHEMTLETYYKFLEILWEFSARMINNLDPPCPFVNSRMAYVQESPSNRHLIRRRTMLGAVLRNSTPVEGIFPESSVFSDCGSCMACKLGKVFANHLFLEHVLLNSVLTRDFSGAFAVDWKLVKRLRVAVDIHCRVFGNKTAANLLARVKDDVDILGLEEVEGSLDHDKGSNLWI